MGVLMSDRVFIVSINGNVSKVFRHYSQAKRYYQSLIDNRIDPTELTFTDIGVEPDDKPERNANRIERMIERGNKIAERHKHIETTNSRHYSSQYEIYCVDNGRTEYLTRAQADKKFGHDEFTEMIQGYLPNYAVTKL